MGMSFIVQENFGLLRDNGIMGLLKRIAGTDYSIEKYKENIFPAIKENMLIHIECLKQR
jgi:hypothetical protein